jgi:ribonuclease BN (tRNA processing enzyme)
MKLTVVGCSGSFPGPASPASCYLVEAGGRRVLLDLGNGALGALATYVDIYSIDAVLLSHLHPDHCFDLASYYVARRYHPDGPKAPIPVYGPVGVAERMMEAYGSDRPDGLARVFDFREWGDGDVREVGPMRVTVTQVAHPVPCFAMRVEHDGRALVYSGDTGPCAALIDASRGADLLLAEASYREGVPNPPDLHLTGRDAGIAATKAAVRRLVITHVPPWYDGDTALADAREVYDGPLELARPGSTYQL